MVDNVLSAGSRSNLLSLRETSRLQDRTQDRLATGRAVSSVVDDALKFLGSKALSDRASDLLARKDGIDQDVSALRVATEATESVENLLNQTKGLLQSARSAGPEAREAIASQIGTLSVQINNLVNDASFQGRNLLNSTESGLQTSLSDRPDSVLETGSVDLTSESLFVDESGTALGAVAGTSKSATDAFLNKLGLSKSLEDYESGSAELNADIDTALANLDSTIDSVRSQAESFGSSVSILEVRSDFARNTANILEEGSDKLTLADLNEEAANSLALQTRQQLATQSLSLSGRSESAILALFG